MKRNVLLIGATGTAKICRRWLKLRFLAIAEP